MTGTGTRIVDADYLVVGAGASGMAFTDALIDHAAVRVAIVDRRHGVGGHWLDAYPFVRLHQASSFYGAASTVLGDHRVQRQGPEAGLFERADQARICSYYSDLVADRMVGSGQVELHGGCEYVGDRSFVSRVSGQRFEVPERCRIVDARYLAPDIPALTPPRFDVDPGARVVPVNDLGRLEEAPSQYVVVGSGKTATDACIWLLAHGVDPDAICWVRPREPWMLNRALIQPDAAVYLAMFADLLSAAAHAPSLDALFLDLEERGIMLRIDQAVTPTMAKAPTLGLWELDLLRSIQDVVRLGHISSVRRGRMHLADGSVGLAPDALIVNCAADGLKNAPRVPIWGSEAITVQPVRAGFPCFGAAVIGYVEATRDDDADKNRICRPSSYGDSLVQWAQMNVIGTRNAQAFGAEPDIRAWTDDLALNPARVSPERRGSAQFEDAQAGIAANLEPGLRRLIELSRVVTNGTLKSVESSRTAR